MLNINRASGASLDHKPEADSVQRVPVLAATSMSALSAAAASAPYRTAVDMMAAAGATPRTSDASTQTEPLHGSAAELIGRKRSAEAMLKPAEPDKLVQVKAKSCQEVIDFIKAKGGLPRGTELTIINANDQELCLLADTLQTMPDAAINLRLHRGGDSFTSKALKRLALLPLHSLVLRETRFGPQDHFALEHVSYPIGLALTRTPSDRQTSASPSLNRVSGWTKDLQSALCLPTLHYLKITDPQVSALEMTLMATQPALKILHVGVPMPDLFSCILSNPGILRLYINGTELGEIPARYPLAFGLLRTHPNLKLLGIDFFNTPELLIEIAANAKLDNLKLGVGRIAAVPTVRALENMPTIHKISLRANEPNVELLQVDIANLCQKPLQELYFRDFEMDEVAVSTAARALTKALYIGGENMTFSSATIDAFCLNKSMNALVLSGKFSPADVAKLAAIPTLRSLQLHQVPSDAAMRVNESAQSAWHAAGKPAIELVLRPSDIGFTAWGSQQ